MAEFPKSILSYDIHDEFDLISIEHDGTASWADLQYVKDAIWGENAVAIELYPPADQVLNGGSTELHIRHLWRLSAWENWPNLRKLFPENPDETPAY